MGQFRDRVRAPRDLQTAVSQSSGGVGWATGAWDKLFFILQSHSAHLERPETTSNEVVTFSTIFFPYCQMTLGFRDPPGEML